MQSGHLFYRCLVVSNATPGQLPLSLPRDPPKVQTRFETKRGGMFSFTESCPCSFSKAPQFGSNNARPFNKSFNKTVHLTFYCRSRPLRMGNQKKKEKIKKNTKVEELEQLFLSASWLVAGFLAKGTCSLICFDAFKPVNDVFKPKTSWVSVFRGGICPNLPLGARGAFGLS